MVPRSIPVGSSDSTAQSHGFESYHCTTDRWKVLMKNTYYCLVLRRIRSEGQRWDKMMRTTSQWDLLPQFEHQILPGSRTVQYGDKTIRNTHNTRPRGGEMHLRETWDTSLKQSWNIVMSYTTLSNTELWFGDYFIRWQNGELKWGKITYLQNDGTQACSNLGNTPFTNGRPCWNTPLLCQHKSAKVQEMVFGWSNPAWSSLFYAPATEDMTIAVRKHGHYEETRTCDALMIDICFDNTSDCDTYVTVT